MVTKKCFVKSCNNNSADNSDLAFVAVPRDMRVRQKWFSAVGIARTTTQPTLYCCADHFDVSVHKSLVLTMIIAEVQPNMYEVYTNVLFCVSIVEGALTRPCY